MPCPDCSQEVVFCLDCYEELPKTNNQLMAQINLLVEALKKAKPYIYRITDGKPNRVTLQCQAAIDVATPLLDEWLKNKAAQE